MNILVLLIIIVIIVCLIPIIEPLWSPSRQIEQVLKTLKGGPKSFKEILKDTGLQPEALKATLEKMYLLKYLNRYQGDPQQPLNSQEYPWIFRLTDIGVIIHENKSLEKGGGE